MRTKLFISFILLLACLQNARAWNGSGTEADPYLISTTTDWQQLTTNVAGGENFSGTVFRMVADINAGSAAAGTESTPFAGIFDGDGHTLTFNRGGADGIETHYDDHLCAPFAYVAGATLRHLHTTGAIFTTHQYAGGIVGMVGGDQATTLIDCSSNADIDSNHSGNNDAAGGLVGCVNTGGLRMEHCVFNGILSANGTAAGMVGWTNVPVTLSFCMVSPLRTVYVNQNNGKTFVRAAGGASVTLNNCYFTLSIGDSSQGTGVFTSITVPEGCQAEIVSEPTIQFDGVSYYTSGAQVRLTAPEGKEFDHWISQIDPWGAFVSDPWTKNGIHTISDIDAPPSLSIATSKPTAKMERKVYGFNYRYLSTTDYHLYVSNEQCREKGYQTDSDGYLVVYDSNGTKNFVTAITSCDPSDSELSSTTISAGWPWSDDEYKGSIILNDIVENFRDHTHLACIAPRALQNVSQLEKLVFMSNRRSTASKDCDTPLNLSIGEQAFAGCANLKELVMMYYNRKAGKWESLTPTTEVHIADNAFEGSSARIVVDPSYYQAFLGSDIWQPHHNRIGIYIPTVDDIKVDGAIYSYMRDNQGSPVKNNASGHETVRDNLAAWNAEFHEFTVDNLLAVQDQKNIWYTQIIGVDNSTLSDGKMIIRNDPGTYYNYKTISIAPNAFAGNENLKSIEFAQVNGDRSSFSDMKMVIHNGAFKGCKNLKELRMFYWYEDGDDHWEVLGPENVIPGNNIFGTAFPENKEDLTPEEFDKCWGVPEGFKILVSPSRYQDFISDPNWLRYITYIEPADFEMSNKKEFTIGDANGITYDYITNPGGIAQTTQTVSQDVSWWTAPRIIAELALYAATFGTWGAASGATAPIDPALQLAATEATNTFTSASAGLETLKGLAELITSGARGEYMAYTGVFEYLASRPADHVLQYMTEEQIASLVQQGLVREVQSASGTIVRQFMGRGVEGFVGNAEIYTAMRRFCFDNMMPLLDGLGKTSWMAAQTATKKAAKTAMDAAIANLAPETARVAAESAKKATLRTVSGVLGSLAAATTTSSVLSAWLWGGSGSYDGDALRKGMRENIISNMHQVALVGGAYVITTPTKNLLYHTYIKKVNDDVEHAVIYAGTDKGQGKNASARTTTLAKNAFRNHKNLKTISFYENNVSTNEALPMVLTIPDSAFVGCDNLEELNLLLGTAKNGTQALGPENFILGGDHIFASQDSTKFHIVIPEERREDFLANASWAPLKRFFTYKPTQPKSDLEEYGGIYAFAYERGSVQKVHKVQGHKIEHTIVVGEATNGFLTGHQGALKLCNDIGSYNNYQLDAVRRKAFYGNPNLRVVNFTDLFGKGAFGDVYTGLDVVLQDSCFADCPNLKNIDMLYLVTDGINHITPIKPTEVKIGRGVLDGTTASIKMMPQQVAWFEADSTWAAYKDRFMACIIKPSDEKVKEVLKPMAYYDMAHEGYDDVYWTDYIDLARIGGAGFSWLDGKFRGTKMRSFTDFKYFGNVGLDYVGKEWFKDCRQLSSIVLPSTTRSIGEAAFENCDKLPEIDLPANVQFISTRAFGGCSLLKTITVHAETPALVEKNAFPTNEGMRIYVPDGKVQEYKQNWPDYAQYIVGESEYPSKKVVTVTETGQLASKLGLTLEKESKKVRYIHGNYGVIDSLTVIGPLNGEDLSVIRHLAGADAYDSDPTDGQMRYLNLWDARIRSDQENSYNGNGKDEYCKNDNEVPDYLFENCTSIETVVLPKSATSIGENIFEDATNLKKVCVGSSTKEYKCDILQNLESIDELVLLTDQEATSKWGDPWEADINVVFTTNSMLGDYLGQPALTKRTSLLTAPLKDDNAIMALAEKGHFFPTEYVNLESLEGIFEYNGDIRKFDDLYLFQNVHRFDHTFTGCYNLESVTLPDSVTSIGAGAFVGCSKLSTIYVNCDSVPQLETNAFLSQELSLGHDFHIYVPKELCKLYRSRWQQYAEYINANPNNYSDEDIITVTLTEANTLAEKLGLTTTTEYPFLKMPYINSLRGDYSHIRRLKVIGPVSGADFAVLRYLSGFCPWTNDRNLSAPLEYLDLYDADINPSDYNVAPDVTTTRTTYVNKWGTLPSYAFLQCYNLRTLILPKSCREVNGRALQQCEHLETLVIGDSTETFNWDALNDDASLTRLYILSKKKLKMTTDFAVWRALCNNYNPTFDAFYVRPSLYDEYIKDEVYTGQSWQLTSNISKGIFDEDDSFCAFAAHAAATADDLSGVSSIDGWFEHHTGVKNLTPLSYTAVRTLRTKDLQPLTQLERIALPATLETMEDSLFSHAPNLRYVDLVVCDSANIMTDLHNRGFGRLGIDSLQTLVYLPRSYGEAKGTNIVVYGSNGFSAETFRLTDDKDYCVPYTFETQHVENSRVLAVKTIPYTICLPYKMKVPTYSRVYQLNGREGSTLTFTEVKGELNALTPYLIKAVGNKRLRKNSVTLHSDIAQPIPTSNEAIAQQDVALGYTMQGTLKRIDNATAAQMGAYVLQDDGNWHPVSSAGAEAQQAYIPAFRAYLLTRDSYANPQIGMTLIDDDTDGIDTIRTIDEDGTERYYDLSGRELDGKPQQGVYIYKGKKYINKK